MRPLILALLLAAAPRAARADTLTLDPQTLEHLRTLPTQDLTVTSGNPPAPHTFQGPLLWAVLVDTHLVDPARHADAVRQVLRLQGTDGYVALLALGELSPEFEGKPALLALTQDGKPLDHPRAFIPNDHRGGRGVHDIATLTLDTTPNPKAKP